MKEMKKRFSQSAILASFFLMGTLVPGVLSWQQPHATGNVYAAERAEETLQAKGKITNISQKAKTIALSTKKDKFFLIKFNDSTKFNGIASAKKLKAGEAVVITYTTIKGENIATAIQKAVVKLPKGVQEIKTGSLAAMLADSPEKMVLIDARPPAKYKKGHIPGAVSLPYGKLKKAGDKGAQLLKKYKDIQLVFYCGGST